LLRRRDPWFPRCSRRLRSSRLALKRPPLGFRPASVAS
jgi:hypothetical protein